MFNTAVSRSQVAQYPSSAQSCAEVLRAIAVGFRRIERLAHVVSQLQATAAGPHVAADAFNAPLAEIRSGLAAIRQQVMSMAELRPAPTRPHLAMLMKLVKQSCGVNDAPERPLAQLLLAHERAGVVELRKAVKEVVLRCTQTRHVSQAEFSVAPPAGHLGAGPNLTQRTRRTPADLIQGLSAPRGSTHVVAAPSAPLASIPSSAVQALMMLGEPVLHPAAQAEPHVTSSPQPRDPLLQTWGQKLKWRKKLYAQHGLGNFTFSNIYLADGRRLIKGPTQARGSYGKVADAMFEDGRAVKTKMVRTLAKQGSTSGAAKKTYFVAPEEVLQEHQRTVQVRKIVDDRIMEEQYEGGPVSQWLQAVRPDISPFEDFGFVNLSVFAGFQETSQHSLLIMSADAGNVFDVSQRLWSLPESKRQVAALALAIRLGGQVFHELSIMKHYASLMHGDLSPNNLFITKFGQIKAMDFGLSEPLNQAGDTQALLHQGTVLTPEGSGANWPDNGSIPLGAKSDVFALSVLVFGAVAEAFGAVNPFYASLRVPNIAPDDSADSDYYRGLMQAFSAWRAEHTDLDTQLVSVDNFLSMNRRDPFTLFFGPLARSHPTLAAHLLNAGMAFAPSERSSSEEMLLWMVSNIEPPQQGLLMLEPLFNDPAQAAEEEATRANLMRAHEVHALLEEQHAAAPHKPGTPYDLPG